MDPLYNGCSPAQFGREAAGKKMQEAEVMEKFKERLMEELMAKLKYDLQKGRKQVAIKGDIAEIGGGLMYPQLPKT